MTNPDDVFFESIKTDKTEYEIAYTKTENVKISGKLSKGGFEGQKLFITIIMPDDNKKELTIFPTEPGYFETFFQLNKESLTGRYKVRAKYIKAESPEITFLVRKK